MSTDREADRFDVNRPLPKWSPAPGKERDPERIDTLIAQISALWKEYPTQRLGQLLVNLCDPNPNPLFNVEDHTISQRIFEVREKGSWGIF